MRKIWMFIKKILKRILPPTVHVFMREVNALHGAMAAREANLSHQLGEARIETNKRLDRLGDLFESANRENLRLFFDAREERKEMAEQYDALAGQYEALAERYDVLAREVRDLRQMQQEQGKEFLARREEAVKMLLARREDADKMLLARREEADKNLLDHQEKMEKQLAEGVGKLGEHVYSAEHSLRSEVQMTRQVLLRRQDEYLDPALYPHALKLWYWQKTGKVLDLENPKTFNEKIQWMKLYDNDPLKTRLADKLLVRDWVKGIIGEEHLVPLLGVWDKAEDIDFGVLPDRFVLKANHGSGMNIVVKDRSTLNIEETRKKLDTWLKTNFAFSNGFELHYLNIEPKIIAEKYMHSEGTDQLVDYKFMCFDGDVDTVIVYTDRGKELHRTFFTPDWERILIDDKLYSPSPDELTRPKTLDEMIEIAKKLSSGFPHVRVDLYESEGNVYFGEMTFSTSSGTSWWSPEQDRRWGEKIALPDTGIYM